MENGQGVAGARGTRPVAVYEVAAALLLVGLAALTVDSWMHPDVLIPTKSIPLDGAITTLAFVIAAGAAYFALGEFMLYGSGSSLVVGLSFLVFAEGNALMGLLPLVGGWNRHSHPVATGWAVERVLGAVLMLLAALLIYRVVPHARRARITAAAVVLAALAPLAAASWAYGTMAGSMTPLHRPLELVASGLLFAASVLFWRAFRRTERTWFVWLALALLVASASQIQYAIRPYELGVVQPGDILRVVFYLAILFALISEWSRSFIRLRWQARELEALHALMTAPVVHDVSAVIQHVVDVVSRSLEARARIVVPEREDLLARDSLSSRLLQLDEDGAMLDGADGKRRVVVTYDETAEGDIALGVPLGPPEHSLGLLAVARNGSTNPFTKQDVHLLRAFGAQASLLLERSLLYEDVAAGAVMEERSRLAREIHDGLAQHLAFLKMRVAWMKRSRSGAKPEQLSDIEGVLETALVEARHAISTLRAEPEGTSAGDAIVGYSEEFSQVSGLPVTVNTSEPMAEVGAKVRVELLRVVQEALNNVRKHAHATEVTVEIESREGGLEVDISDDGVGIDRGEDREGHFGLEIMRERVESVGGRLHIDSAPGAGTKVHVWVPGRDAEAQPLLHGPIKAG